MPILLAIALVAAIAYVLSHRRKGNQSSSGADSVDGTTWKKPLLALTIPPGTHTAMVYTYDGRPLEGLPLNTLFELEVMPGVCNMQSVYTNMNWSGTGGVRYKGQMVGFITDAGPRNEILTNIASRHGSVFVHANIRGYDRQGGWPLISVRLPSTPELRKIR